MNSTVKKWELSLLWVLLCVSISVFISGLALSKTSPLYIGTNLFFSMAALLAVAACRISLPKRETLFFGRFFVYSCILLSIFNLLIVRDWLYELLFVMLSFFCSSLLTFLMAIKNEEVKKHIV